jgi:hypothetical protein
VHSIRFLKDGAFNLSGPVAQLVRAADEDSTQRKKSKELTNISPSVTPIITASPPELQELINRWDDLPEHVRQTIQMLVDTAGGKSRSVNDLGEM